MPELPEVETIASDLRPQLVGRTIIRASVRFPSIVRHPGAAALEAGVAGARVGAVTRRGKYILVQLEPDVRLVFHLGMTGHLMLHEPEEPPAPHTHAIFDLDSGVELRYRDPRRFGRILLGTDAELAGAGILPRLGPEPLDPAYRPADLASRLAGRRAAVKSLLLDQSTVAGVGNIYADEALHRARIRPQRPGGSLAHPAVRRLHAALIEVLEQGVRNRGSSVNSYMDGFGDRGRQQEVLRVYGRAGQACLTCGRPLTSIRIGGRTTVYCRRCQR